MPNTNKINVRNKGLAIVFTVEAIAAPAKPTAHKRMYYLTIVPFPLFFDFLGLHFYDNGSGFFSPYTPSFDLEPALPKGISHLETVYRRGS